MSAGRTRQVVGDRTTTTETVILSFNSSHLPECVKLYSMSFQVRPYFPSPFRCKKCQRLEHTEIKCSNKVTSCPICCQYHEQSDISCTMWCINCQESRHRADSPTCQSFVVLKLALRVAVTEKIAINVAKSRIVSENKMGRTRSLHYTPLNQSIKQRYNNFDRRLYLSGRKLKGLKQKNSIS